MQSEMHHNNPTMYRAYVDIFIETGQHGVDTTMGYINKMHLTVKAGTQMEDSKTSSGVGGRKSCLM